MRERSFGTCLVRPHRTLRWGSPVDVADDICCHSRGKLEPKKLYLQLLGTDALSVAEWRKHETMTFYDTVTSKPLFIIDNKVRRFKDFMLDSKRHGHPTFREHERVAENTEVLRDFGSLGGAARLSPSTALISGGTYPMHRGRGIQSVSCALPASRAMRTLARRSSTSAAATSTARALALPLPSAPGCASVPGSGTLPTRTMTNYLRSNTSALGDSSAAASPITHWQCMAPSSPRRDSRYVFVNL